MKIAREIKIGVLVVVALGLLYFGLNFLKGIDVFNKQQMFYVEYPSVNGLETSNPVVINGYQVGVVRHIKLMHNDEGNLVVTFALNEDFDLPVDTRARLQSSDLLGSMQLNLLLGTAEATVTNGDTLTGEVESGLKEAVNEQIRPLKNKAENLISSVDSTLTTVQQILNKDARGNLTQSFRGLRKAIENIEQATKRIDNVVAKQDRTLSTILGNVESITENLRNNNEQITNILANLSQVSDTLVQVDIRETVANANEAVASFKKVMTRIDNGEGSLGMLINNDSLYNKLASASNQLDLLVEDIRVHPKRYIHFSVFGQKEHGTKLTRKELKQLQEYLDKADTTETN